MAKRPKSFRKRLKETVMELFFATLTIVSVFVLRRVVGWLLGGDVLWDRFPLRYCTDTADALVFARFLWNIARTFND